MKQGEIVSEAQYEEPASQAQIEEIEKHIKQSRRVAYMKNIEGLKNRIKKGTLSKDAASRCIEGIHALLADKELDSLIKKWDQVKATLDDDQKTEYTNRLMEGNYSKEVLEEVLNEVVDLAPTA